MKARAQHPLFDLNDAALAHEMTIGQRLRWLALMMCLGAACLAALWACR